MWRADLAPNERKLRKAPRVAPFSQDLEEGQYASRLIGIRSALGV